MIELPQDIANDFLAYALKFQSSDPQIIAHIIAVVAIVARNCKQPECHSTDEWIVNMHSMRYYSGVKMNNIE